MAVKMLKKPMASSPEHTRVYKGTSLTRAIWTDDNKYAGMKPFSGAWETIRRAAIFQLPKLEEHNDTIQ